MWQLLEELRTEMENIFVSGRTQALPAPLHLGPNVCLLVVVTQVLLASTARPRLPCFVARAGCVLCCHPMHVSLTTPRVYNQTLGGRDVNPRGKAARRAAMARAAEQRLKVGVHCCGHQDTRTAF